MCSVTDWKPTFHFHFFIISLPVVLEDVKSIIFSHKLKLHRVCLVTFLHTNKLHQKRWYIQEIYCVTTRLREMCLLRVNQASHAHLLFLALISLARSSPTNKRGVRFISPTWPLVMAERNTDTYTGHAQFNAA